MSRPFANRAEAGRILAEKLADYANRSDVIVLGLPRGGVPVAYEVASALRAPLDVFLVRKLGAPGQEELAMGAIASGDIVVINDEVVEALRISSQTLKTKVDSERQELARREAIFRGGRPPLDVDGKTVILIDDGLATGSTMRAAVAALRRQEPAQIVVAVPIGASSTCDELRTIADECICAVTPEHFRAVGLWYDDFAQTDDIEVCDLLTRAAGPRARVKGNSGDSAEKLGNVCAPAGPDARPGTRPRALTECEATIVAGDRPLRGSLKLPTGATAVVVFAHGSGSGRLSPRNQYVAQVLQQVGLGTLLVDLLEDREADDRNKVFDIPLLARRLGTAADWVASQPETKDLRLGYFGASTGAGAALLAEVEALRHVGAIVSRGGRPDLARTVLPRVTAPTLLIVGGNDEIVLKLNREAFDVLQCPRRLEVIPGASHLFPEPGALEEVARLAKQWFLHYLIGPGS
jgi:putative phosphoribosyl transferase